MLNSVLVIIASSMYFCLKTRSVVPRGVAVEHRVCLRSMDITLTLPNKVISMKPNCGIIRIRVGAEVENFMGTTPLRSNIPKEF